MHIVIHHKCITITKWLLKPESLLVLENFNPFAFSNAIVKTVRVHAHTVQLIFMEAECDLATTLYERHMLAKVLNTHTEKTGHIIKQEKKAQASVNIF